MKKDNQVIVDYKDDGVGLPEEMVLGLGLKSMEARIKAIGGTMEFIRGEGFKAQLVLPLKEE